MLFYFYDPQKNACNINNNKSYIFFFNIVDIKYNRKMLYNR